jgi:divalent metal cation (Fe/Co/Zn/Cd) transporter
MKFVFLVGGFAGFLLATIAGLSAGRTAELVLRDAAIACLISAFVFRAFWSVVAHALSDAAHARREQARARTVKLPPTPTMAAGALPTPRRT